jgi:peptidoglycan/xylan/chitin deacetylase (PgdA/CDA1 family)
VRRLWHFRRSVLYGRWPWRDAVRRLWPRALILLYHRVSEGAADSHGLAVEPGTFARQLRLLRSHYQVESLETLVGRLPEGGYRDGTVVVTFDDGYVDNLTTAYPIAADAGIPYTVFVTLQPVIENRLFWWDELAEALLQVAAVSGSLSLALESECVLPVTTPADRQATYTWLHDLLRRMPAEDREQVLSKLRSAGPADRSLACVGRPMTVAELLELAALPGVAIGAHSMTHSMLSALPAVDQAYELGESRRVLEDILGRPVLFAAYPFGKPNDVARETCLLAARAGYRAALTTRPGAVTPSSPALALPRLSVHDWTDDQFMQKVNAFLG